MSGLAIAALFVLTAGPEAGWDKVAESDGITVYTRERDNSPVRETKAVGMVDAPPPEVWKILRAYERFTERMPYTEEAKVLARSPGDKTIDFYSVVNVPLVDRRDYVIRLVDESDWRGGQGFLKVTWSATDQGAPPPRKGVVRMSLNDGYWLLEPRENGTKTWCTYYLYTDPGGRLPKFVVNQANKGAVPDCIRALRKGVAKP